MKLINRRGQFLLVGVIMLVITVLVLASFMGTLVTSIGTANAALAAYPEAQVLLALLPVTLIAGVLMSIFIYNR